MSYWSIAALFVFHENFLQPALCVSGGTSEAFRRLLHSLGTLPGRLRVLHPLGGQLLLLEARDDPAEDRAVMAGIAVALLGVIEVAVEDLAPPGGALGALALDELVVFGGSQPDVLTIGDFI